MSTADLLHGWTPARRPGAERLEGTWVSLEPLDPEIHAEPLYRAFSSRPSAWDYMPYGPFESAQAMRAWIASVAGRQDPLFHAIRPRDDAQVAGVASYLRITPDMGTIEIGHINLSPLLARTRAATEALSLMIATAFELGYRRCEWKCDARNMASRRAAQRLGFSYEGVFRQAAVVKGRNRDTAWFAIIDGDWAAIRDAHRAWLEPANFRSDGTQLASLSASTAPLLAMRDPSLTG